MQQLPKFTSPNLLLGAEHFSDAGVYRLSDDIAVVQSLDFFPPIVNDPFVYGQVAAANALSDIYALLARPRTALNIVCFPDKELDEDVLHAILAGGAERVEQAGAVVLGGHSVRDTEVKFGLSVTGVVHPDEWVGNDGARPGDVLVLTKSLGTGFIATAVRGDCCPEEVRLACEASMIALNAGAADAARAIGVNALTDITGFGLAGHGFELAEASGVTLAIDAAALPILPGALALTDDNRTRANATNDAHVAPGTRWEGERTVESEFLFDPQTSGGLLLSVPADRAEALVAACRDRGASASAIIGCVLPPEDGTRLVLRTG